MIFRQTQDRLLAQSHQESRMKKGHEQIRSVKTCVTHKDAESQSNDPVTGLTLKRIDETTPLGKHLSVLSRLIKEAKRAVCHIDRMEITRGSCKELRKDSAVRFPLWISDGSRAGTGLPDLADENLPRLHDSFGAQRSVCLGVQPSGAESTPAANQVHSLTFTGTSIGVLVMLECEAVRSSPL